MVSRQDTGTSHLLSYSQIVSVLLLGLVARLAVLWYALHNFSAAWFFHRGMEMGLLAQSILDGKGLSSPFGGSTGPTAFIAPGYPLIVTTIFACFGKYTVASAIVVMGFNVALNLLTAYLIMHIAAQLADARAAVLAGAIWAISVPLIVMPTIFWETSFSCFFMVASLAFALRLQRTPTNRGFVAAGFCIAVAGLINPALLPVLLAILCWASFHARKLCPRALLFAAVTIIVVFSPWPIRNARVFHAFIPLRSTVGFEMWMGNHPQSTGYLDETLFPTTDNPAELHEYLKLGEVAYVKRKSAGAKAYIVSNPGTFALLSLRRAARFWTGSGSRGGSLIFILHASVITILGFVGIRLMFRERPDVVCLGLLVLALFPLPYYITHAEFRYRLVMDPVLLLFAARAFEQLSVESHRRSNTAKAHALISALNCGAPVAGAAPFEAAR